MPAREPPVRSLMSSSTRLRALAALATLIGCGDNIEIHVAEGPRVNLYYPGSSPVCGGSVDYLNEAIASQMDFLELPLPSPIDYHFLPEDLWHHAPCSKVVEGCMPDDEGLEVYGKEPFIAHELVHALERQNYHANSAFFIEGLAVAMGGDSHFFSDQNDYDILPGYLRGDGPQIETLYGTGGDFTSYLLTRFGVGMFHEFHSTQFADGQHLLDRFQEVYSVPLSEMIEQRIASQWTFVDRATLATPQCNSPTIPWQNGEAAADITLDCSSDAIGFEARVGSSGENRVHLYRTVDIPVDGSYRLSVAKDSEAWVDLNRCVADFGATVPIEAFKHSFPWLDRYQVIADLRAGRYFQSYVGPSRSPSRIETNIAPTASDCDNPLPATLTSDPIFMASHPSTTLAVTFTATEDVAVAAGWLNEASLELCRDCGTSCLPLEESEFLAFGAGETFTARSKSESWGGVALLTFHAPPPDE